MSVIDINEVRQDRQDAINWGIKINDYFSKNHASDAEMELLDDVSNGNEAECRLAVAVLDMIVDGLIVASYENGKMILTRTEKLVEKLKTEGLIEFIGG